MKFGVIVATNSDCVSLSLGLCSLFTFGVGSLLLQRFDALFKCTVDYKLQPLTTPYSNVPCS